MNFEWLSLRLPSAVAEVPPAREAVAGARRVLMARERLTEGGGFLVAQHRARRERQTIARVAAAILHRQLAFAP